MSRGRSNISKEFEKLIRDSLSSSGGLRTSHIARWDPNIAKTPEVRATMKKGLNTYHNEVYTHTKSGQTVICIYKMLKSQSQKLIQHLTVFIGHSTTCKLKNMLNRISHSITDADLQEAIALVQNSATKIALPPNLPSAENAGQYLGQSSMGYVQDCLAAAKTYPNIPSGIIKVDEMQKDLTLVAQLDNLLTVFQPLVKALINARQLAGQDLMANSNQIRESFLNATKHDVSLRNVSDNLKKRYQLVTSNKDKPADLNPPTL